MPHFAIVRTEGMRLVFDLLGGTMEKLAATVSGVTNEHGSCDGPVAEGGYALLTTQYREATNP